MKKIILLFFIIFGFAVTSKAQIQYYKSTAYAYANIYNGRYVWGDWQDSNVLITINLTTDVITVYSPKTQVYKVYRSGEVVNNSKVGKQLTFYVIDQDYDKGHVRLRIANDGTSQIYVDFNNVAWVYNVIRIK